MRTYTHKLYDIQWNYIRVLSENIVFSDFSIDGSIDSGVASYEFTIDKQYDDPIEANEYILVVKEYSPDNKDGRIVFAGTLDGIDWKLAEDENTITYKFWWLHRLLSKIICPMSAYTNQTVASLVQTVVDTFNAQYPILTDLLDGYLIKNAITDTTTITKTTATTDMTCLTQLLDIIKLSWWWFYCKADWTLVWWQKPTEPSHKFMMKRDVLSLDIERVNINDIVNSVMIWWTRFDDATSISLYGKKQKIEKLDTTDYTTISNFATKYLAENAFGRREITMEIMVKDYSNIYPWQTISIKNTRLDNVSNVRIEKIKYNGYTMDIYLEKYVSLAQLIIW